MTEMPEFEIARLQLRPGERLVVKVKADRLPFDVINKIASWIRAELGADIPILVIDNSIDLSTVSPPQATADYSGADAKLIAELEAHHGCWCIWDGEWVIFTSLPERAAAALKRTQMSASHADEDYQDRVRLACAAVFDGDPTDVVERRDRFAEEANEVCQAFGMTREEAHQLVDYTYSRPTGEPGKEIGAAMTTLASLANEAGHDLMACAEADLAKLMQPETIARIRAKRATRHGRGPLPGLGTAAKGLTELEMKAQGTRCGCGGADDYCPCQNAPDRQTARKREAAGR